MTAVFISLFMSKLKVLVNQNSFEWYTLGPLLSQIRTKMVKPRVYRMAFLHTPSFGGGGMETAQIN